MLFSRMDDLPSTRRIEIDSTEIGIDAATVRPAFKPTYTVTAPKRMPNSAPMKTARKVISGRVSCEGTKGRKAGDGVLVVDMGNPLRGDECINFTYAEVLAGFGLAGPYILRSVRFALGAAE